LFKRADLFSGTLRITASGLSGNPITMDLMVPAYACNFRIRTLSSWTDEGKGIFSATVNTESPPEVVTIDGIQFCMGRHPNSEFLKYESFSPMYQSLITNYLHRQLERSRSSNKEDKLDHGQMFVTNHTGPTITYRSLGTL